MYAVLYMCTMKGLKMCKSWKNVSSHWTEIYCYLWKEMHSTYSENKPKYFNTSNVKDLCELFDTND
jgi:hypothetical protein